MAFWNEVASVRARMQNVHAWLDEIGLVGGVYNADTDTKCA